MEFDDLNVIFLELKYCERCGGLWLRARNSANVFCGWCCTQMAELRKAHGKHTLRLTLKTRMRVDGENRDGLVICGEGGNA